MVFYETSFDIDNQATSHQNSLETAVYKHLYLAGKPKKPRV